MQKTGTASTTQRMVYLDIFRIAAIFSVIVIHVTACDWSTLPVWSWRWQVLNLFNAANRWCIAAFAMMSGRAFLDLTRSVSFADLIKKNIPRMLFSLLFWATAYHLYETALINGTLTARDLLGGVAAVFTLSARRHLWFLYMMIGLYLLTPLLRKLVARFTLRTLTVVSIALLLLSGGSLFLLSSLPSFAYMQYVMQVPGFIGLFLLGYCMEQLRFSARVLRTLCIAGILGVVITIAGTSFLSLYTGTATQILYTNTVPNVVITAVGLLAFGRKKMSALSFGAKWDKRISWFSSLTFGIYLIHDFFIIPIELGLGGMSMSIMQPTLSVVAFSCWIMLLCTPVVYLLRKIPVINQYIA